MRHYHVYDSSLGCLPESDPYVTDDPSDAVETLASLLADWGESDDTADGAYAAEVAATYRAPDQEASGKGCIALSRLECGHEVCEIVGSRSFEIPFVTNRIACGTALTTGAAPSCWCCGTRFVLWDACPWLD
ncbi:hypothetical protein BZB76_5160 [Actinomadura pelletieri DSM 43383]|uniref:Uncharacterized protein n=1 Tax=Actinomadura pelletieri DSM 43383 TaxID=1120940 RepID=A0A495QFN8_9ACTN|nr:hypothetical protein [Actinomadura pelletieri]RKS70684.1 hypothetical protein BZB76_5160 [Actinomadura pelletieri DSM 43383]